MVSQSHKLTHARDYARQAHGEQKYGDHPYIYHLDQVSALAAPFGEQAQIIAYLHDVLEDTDVSCLSLRNEFGDFIAESVSLISDEEGENRQIRKQRTYRKLKSEGDNYKLSLVVKACDRLANLRECLLGNNSRLYSMYVTEHELFKCAVFRAGLCDEIWSEIDSIIGQSLYS